MITVLVAAHEYGHYLFARIFKMGVEEFAIGFGRKTLWVWARRKHVLNLTEKDRLNLAARDNMPLDEVPHQIEEETQYTFRPWPVGGFVRIKGMLPLENGAEVLEPAGFYSRPIWQRILVLFAGPLFSVIAGSLIIFTTLMAFGMPDRTPIIGEVTKGGPAYAAGLQAGDKILKLDKETVTKFSEISEYLKKDPKSPVVVTYMRGTEVKSVPVALVHVVSDEERSKLTAKQIEEALKQPRMLIHASEKKYTPSIAEAGSIALLAPVDALGGVIGMIRSPASAKDNVGGPVAIASTTAKMVDLGLEQVLLFGAQLSISVGILNLLPFLPFLDGGQIAIALVEAARKGKRLSLELQSTIMLTGFALGLLLVVSVTMMDIQRNIANQKANSANSSR